MESEIKNILVPIDGTESSKKALQVGLDMARHAHAHLTVLEVIEEFGPLPGYYEAAPADISRVIWISEKRFAPIKPLLTEARDVEWDREVVEGYAADKICEFADKGHYDQIVIGSRGLNALGRFLIGSVSDSVVHHAHCNVTVLKKSTRRTKRRVALACTSELSLS